ncbi:MAG: family 78 glycoside hydrolase catalytic domain [Clostridia bacterium]|nr:family 78 glycoside hydrolase catalytic domain [Clostridia bacterium]
MIAANWNFIAATIEYNTLEKAVAAPYLRKVFNCDAVTMGKLKIAACGFYELYINGERITKGYLAPYISNTDDYIYYDEYEVELQKGENVIAFLLGNGLQNNPGGYIWDFDKAPFRSAPKVAIIMTYENNGEEVTLLTDETFKTHASPIIADDYRFGESYNANLEIENWNKVGFDDSLWSNAINVKPPKGEIKLCEAEPIIKETEIKPVDIIKDEDGYIYDFGISHAGVCRLCVDGVKGQEIVLRYTDMLKEGKFQVANVWFVRDYWERDKHIVHKDVYICKGEKNETYTQTFTYHGFRYVKVTGITEEQATKDLLTFVVLHSDLKSRGSFNCSNETVNKLQEITRRSDISNFHYFPTDCPQREKNGWTADAALSAEQMLLNFNPEKSYREWMNNVRKAMSPEGVVPGIVPTANWGYSELNGPAWDSALFYLPYFTYVYRGETAMISESVDAFIKYFKYLESRKEQNGLLDFGLGDWCHVGRHSPEVMPKAPRAVTDSIISMDMANKASLMFEAVGLKEYKNYADKFASDLKAAIRENLINFNTMTVSGDCQSSQAMALYYGVFEADEEAKAFEKLLEFVHEFDDHIDVGVLGGRVIFHVLSRFGYSSLAYKMITRPDYPSYGNWIKRGATTLWENFDPNFMDSPNHHFWGDISAWFYKTLAGIVVNPTGKNFNEVIIKPDFIDELDYVNATHIMPQGELAVSWERKDKAIQVTVKLPQGVSGCFMYGGNKEQIAEGEYNFTLS